MAVIDSLECNRTGVVTEVIHSRCSFVKCLFLAGLVVGTGVEGKPLHAVL